MYGKELLTGVSIVWRLGCSRQHQSQTRNNTRKHLNEQRLCNKALQPVCLQQLRERKVGRLTQPGMKGHLAKDALTNTGSSTPTLRNSRASKYTKGANVSAQQQSAQRMGQLCARRACITTIPSSNHTLAQRSHTIPIAI